MQSSKTNNKQIAAKVSGTIISLGIVTTQLVNVRKYSFCEHIIDAVKCGHYNNNNNSKRSALYTRKVRAAFSTNGRIS